MNTSLIKVIVETDHGVLMLKLPNDVDVMIKVVAVPLIVMVLLPTTLLRYCAAVDLKSCVGEDTTHSSDDAIALEPVPVEVGKLSLPTFHAGPSSTSRNQ